MAKAPQRDKDPMLGGGAVGNPPELSRRQVFDDLGSYGLRAYSGYVREEFLVQLQGRQAQRVYREMLDNSSVVGAVMFAIHQAMRRVTWRILPAGAEKEGGKPSAKAEESAKFVESLMHDMSHTWEDFVFEAVSMLGYGFSVHEIVYKRRNGRRPHSRPGPKPSQHMATSDFDDGKIGWRRLPIRGQDTILKWFFDANGGVQGVTQQPYAGPTIDIPIEKALLFRAGQQKNSPEGKSVLRNAYRSYYFVKRLEELEAISVERMNGFPVISVPSQLIDSALAVDAQGQQTNPAAAAAYAAYKTLATNIRVDEQMGMVLPSDVWTSTLDGKPSSVRQFQLEFLTPTGGSSTKADTDKIISRYKNDIMMTVLADFIQMGHEVRGTNNLAVTKVDMFYQAIEGWLDVIAAVLNRYALPRLWALNGDDPDLMPTFKPDMAQRLDLDSLGGYITALFGAQIPLGDVDTQTFLREAGGLPATEEAVAEAGEVQQQQAQDALDAQTDSAVTQIRAKPAAASPAKAKPKAKAKAKA